MRAKIIRRHQVVTITAVEGVEPNTLFQAFLNAMERFNGTAQLPAIARFADAGRTGLMVQMVPPGALAEVESECVAALCEQVRIALLELEPSIEIS